MIGEERVVEKVENVSEWIEIWLYGVLVVCVDV